MNKNKRSNKEIIAEKQAEKEKLEKDIAKLKKQENLKRTNKQSWKGEIGDNSFVMLYSTLYNSIAYRDLKPISKDIYIGMVLYAKGNFITEYPYRIYKNICSKATFQTAIKELVGHGFIEIISSGKFNHKPNEYKFCDNWHKWNKNNN